MVRPSMNTLLVAMEPKIIESLFERSPTTLVFYPKLSGNAQHVTEKPHNPSLGSAAFILCERITTAEIFITGRLTTQIDKILLSQK